jgi:hypothetical protein
VLPQPLPGQCGSRSSLNPPYSFHLPRLWSCENSPSIQKFKVYDSSAAKYDKIANRGGGMFYMVQCNKK